MGELERLPGSREWGGGAAREEQTGRFCPGARLAWTSLLTGVRCLIWGYGVCVMWPGCSLGIEKMAEVASTGRRWGSLSTWQVWYPGIWVPGGGTSPEAEWLPAPQSRAGLLLRGGPRLAHLLCFPRSCSPAFRQCPSARLCCGDRHSPRPR